MLRPHLILATALALMFSLASFAEANIGDVPAIIEQFVMKQFPKAISHYWIVNEAREADQELIVDINAVVTERREQPPVENRYLLLIVEGKLAAAQHVPLDAKPDCKPEQQET